MNSDELKNLLPLLITLLLPVAAKYGVSASDLTSAVTGLAGIALGIWLHWNQKKVPENSTAIATSAPMPIGSTVPPTVAAAAKVVGAVALTIALAGMIGPVRAAQKESARPPLTGNIVNDLNNAVNGTTSTATASMTNALAKPFLDLANFVADDSDAAITLSTAIPDIQDGNGQACWMAMKSFASIIKAHPIPATLKLESDLEALRLAEMAANKVCANTGCRSVFDDLTNLVQAASPLPANVVPITFSGICAKVPQVAVVAPTAVSTVTPTPAPAAPK